jgi:hypothetical protein
MFRKLAGGQILCEPMMEGGRIGYRFVATRTFDHLLTAVKVLNEFDGGRAIQSSLVSLLRFETQGITLYE